MGTSNTKKPKASDRTVDMFTGTTRLEQQAAAAEELEPEQREPFSGIDGEINRWREQAFQGQEWTTKHFYEGNTEENQRQSAASCYRMTLRNGWLYLEKKEYLKQSDQSYHYAGLMMPEMDLFLLLEALLKASWSKSKENVRQMFKEVCK